MTPVRSPEIGELRAFCAAADLGSLGRAGRLLRISQPALSKRLRALEALTGARLLDRTPRGVTLTPAGTRLYVEARKLLVQAEAVDELMSGLSGDEGPVRLAASHTIAEFVLPGPLAEFERRRHRHLSVELIVGNSVVVRDMVAEGRAEFGIAALATGTRAASSLHEVPFCDDEVVVGVPEQHPWAALEEIDPAELVRTPLIMRDPSANTRRIVAAALEERGLTLAAPVAEVGSTSAAKAHALSEGVPILLSRLALGADGDRLVARRVAGMRFTRRFVLVRGAGGTRTPAARTLIDHLLQAAEALDGGVAATMRGGSAPAGVEGGTRHAPEPDRP
jgi:DNA-binding transcriptional LysR family regulator